MVQKNYRAKIRTVAQVELNKITEQHRSSLSYSRNISNTGVSQSRFYRNFLKAERAPVVFNVKLNSLDHLLPDRSYPVFLSILT